MNYNLKPNFKVAGPALGAKIKAFGRALAKADPGAFIAGETVKMDLGGEEFDITPDMVDVKIDAKEGFAVAMENNIFIILDATLTSELISEGLAREVISKVQQLRKQKDFEMMDNIVITLDGDGEVQAAVREHEAYIMKETLARTITLDGQNPSIERYKINDHDTGIHVKKA